MHRPTNAALALLTSLLLAVGAAACSDDAAADPIPEDSGVTLDAAGGDTAAPDVTKLGDVGEAPDPGTPADVPQTPDAGATDEGPASDAGADVLSDAGSLEEVSVDPDAGLGDVAVGDAIADVDWETIFSECEVLGIGTVWTGQWGGEIDYDMDTNGLFNPEQGVLLSGGVVDFEISCIDSKLVVNGEMVGTAEANGWDPVPFTLGLSGYYSPSTGKLNASIVDGVVTMFQVVELYFEGNMVGDLLEDGTFSGTWTGFYTGTNAGESIQGTAVGDGSWNAEEAP